MEINWPTKKLGEVLNYEQPSKYIVRSKDYSDDYETLVLTAGKTFILGKTNEEDHIFPANKLPVIIFDDFTTAIQFVDFPFKVKSSAMKILHARKGIADIKYFFYLMQTIKINHATHKRYWISEYSNIEIPLPPVEEQRRIVKKIEELFTKIDEAQKLRAESKAATDSLLAAELHKIFEEGKKKGWEEKELGSLFEITSSKRVFQSEWQDYGVPFYRARELVNLAGGRPFKNPIFVSENMYEKYKEKYGVPNEGDILVTGVGTLGVTYLVKKEDKFYFKDGNIIWFKMKEVVIPEFVDCFFKSDCLKDQIQQNAGGATVKTFTIKTAKKIKIPLPPLAEQKKIVRHLDSLTVKIKELQRLQAETAEEFFELKQSILHKAFSGELFRESNPLIAATTK